MGSSMVGDVSAIQSSLWTAPLESDLSSVQDRHGNRGGLHVRGMGRNTFGAIIALFPDAGSPSVDAAWAYLQYLSRHHP